MREYGGDTFFCLKVQTSLEVIQFQSLLYYAVVSV